MSFNIQLFPDEPILLVTIGEDFDPKRDVEVLIQHLVDAVQKLDKPVYNITDIRISRFSFGDIVSALAMLTRGSAILRHPNFRNFTVVTTNELARISSKALGQEQYGRLSVTVFESLDEALAHVRQQIAAQQG